MLQGSPPESIRELIAMEMEMEGVAPPAQADKTVGDLPKDAQEVADVLGLDEDNAGYLWTQWFTPEAQAQMAAEGVDVPDVWNDLKGLTPKDIRADIAIDMEEDALRARAEKKRADQ